MPINELKSIENPAKILQDILVNDSLDVLSQNYDRFLDSNLIPTPRNLSDLAQGVDLYKAKEQIIITKKTQMIFKNLLSI
jgi:hypothetical protein